jgi:hypothetical protein
MASKLHLTCPLCGSSDVFYSCEPKCCFNHVCADCKATFEPVTHKAEGKRTISPPDPLPDSSDPTAACCVCESVAVYVDDDGALVCADCRQVLTLELTEVAAP